MKFDIITIFPRIFNSYLNESILKRAQKKKLIKIKIHNLRDFSADKRKKIDDRPFGGGPGMVMRLEPIVKAVQAAKSKIKRDPSGSPDKSGQQKSKIKVILFSPAGKQFDNKIAGQLAKNYDNLILICGRYEGIDERVKKVIRNWKLEIGEFSIGPYVLTGGELPAMILIDAVSRQITGVLGKEESIEEKRLGIGVPVYTRPEVFIYKPSHQMRIGAMCGGKGKKYRVPKILLSGNHKKIEEWRKKSKD